MSIYLSISLHENMKHLPSDRGILSRMIVATKFVQTKADVNGQLVKLRVGGRIRAARRQER